MAISLDSEGRGVEPIAVATTAPLTPPTLSRHALRSAAAEVEPARTTAPSVEPAPAAPTERPSPAAPAPVHPAPAADPGSFWNLPNSITALRAAVVPVLLLQPLFPGEVGSTAMAWIFIV